MRQDIDTGSDPAEPSVDRLSRYDLVLLVVPLAFLGALLVSALADVSTQSALSGAALVGAAVVADGLFRRPPRRPTSV
ncbi:hypothetical protein ACFPYI_17450 [Halomarina salina]|uniref:Uncharacterized protein n=1 Tax=Halomarina salina TaxID=1872699 RepID=A0ABD5RR23_9EURY|nr:hypothetical protein [Halomarina salina]